MVFYVIWMDIQEYGSWGEMEPAGKKWLYPILVLFPLGTFRFSFARISLKSVMPWKQLHILSWVVFLALALHAYSNVCTHQKGPICKAAVDSEFIVCPWHNFQYKVKDGKGPVGFNDFIPYYQTSVEDEFVWVSLMN